MVTSPPASPPPARTFYLAPGQQGERPVPQREGHACVGGVKGQSQHLPSLTRGLPRLCERSHLSIEWNCPGRGDSACDPQGRACLLQGWGASCMPGSGGTAPGTHHRETMVPMGSRLHPLCQKDRITCLGRPRRPRLLGLEETSDNISPGHSPGLGHGSLWCWVPDCPASSGQRDPPCWGTGQEQVLERVLVCPLQGWEHAVHSDHGHQPPGTAGVNGQHWGTAILSPVPAISGTLAASPHLPPSWVHTWARQVRAVQLSLRAGAGGHLGTRGTAVAQRCP